MPNQISRLEKSLPRADSQGFVLPTDEEMSAFSAIAADLRENRLQPALDGAQAHGYELLWYTDRGDDDAASYLLREADPSRNGWGLYVFRAVTTSGVIVEAPHPIADANTPAVAVDVYRALHARSLLIAGAHRDANRDGSADAAHHPQSVFQSIHDSELDQALRSSGSAVVLQIHGFATSSHPAYPDVIVSYEHGDINPADLVRGRLLESEILSALRDRSVEADTCGAGKWRDLCGSTNIQASTMRHGVFIHLELDDGIRDQDRRLLAALVEVLAPSP